MRKRSRENEDEIFEELADFDAGCASPAAEEAGRDLIFRKEALDRDAVFCQPEAPRPYSLTRKLWYKARNKTCVPGMTRNECLKLGCDELVLRLQQAGFYKITTAPSPDLSYRKRDLLGMAASVSIGEQEEFHRQTEFPFDAPVHILYHTFKKVSLGFSPQELRNSNVCDTVAYFKHQGFGVVKSVPIHDLKVGWLKIDGQVDRVLVDGFDRFRPDSQFPVDTEIIVYYHTFKKGGR